MGKKKKDATPAPQEQEPQSSDVQTAPALSAELEKELAKHHAAAKKAPKDDVETTVDDPLLRDDDTSPTAPEEIGAVSTTATVQIPTEKAELKDELSEAETDKAVDDIVRNEADEVLESEDAKRAAQPPQQQQKKHHPFTWWWRNKIARTMVILLLLLGITAVFVYPTSRYYVLNRAGVRSGLSLTVLDDSTQLPLKNVTVRVGSKEVRTNSNGYAELKDLRLGPQTLTVQRAAFSPITQRVTIGWGSNPMGKFMLQATGAHYTITVRDFLSGKPLEGAEAEVRGAVARADKKGIITLTLTAPEAGSSMNAIITAKQFRTAELTLSSDPSQQAAVELVPAGQAVFVQRQEGRYDLIAMDIDGQNRQILLKGTGSEEPNTMALEVDLSGRQAALVSTRDGLRDNDGVPLRTLTLVSTENGTALVVSQAKQISIIGWSGTRLIFMEASANTTGDDPQRFKLISYDYATNKRVSLATANEFSAALLANNHVLYGTRPSTVPGKDSSSSFFSIDPDGQNRQMLLDKEVWTAIRTSYQTVALQTTDGWYEYNINGTLEKGSAPSDLTGRQYVSGNNHNIWVRATGAKGEIMDYVTGAAADKSIYVQEGLSYPLRWLTDTAIVYRVVTDTEVADYVVSINGGEPKKVAPVVNTFGSGFTN